MNDAACHYLYTYQQMHEISISKWVTYNQSGETQYNEILGTKKFIIYLYQTFWLSVVKISIQNKASYYFDWDRRKQFVIAYILLYPEPIS